MSHYVPTLRDGFMKLVPLEEDYLDLARYWRNAFVNREQFVDNHIITFTEQWQFWERYEACQDEMMWLILWHDKPVGTAALHGINFDLRMSEYGRLIIHERRYMLADRDLIKSKGGAAKMVTDLITDYAFNKMGLSMVYANVFEDNGAPFQFLEHCGFEIITGFHIVERGKVMVRLENRK